MSAQITDIARDLNVPAADIVAIVNQLSEVDYNDTVDADRPVLLGDVIECPDGTYANVYLTPAAIEALLQQYGAAPRLLDEKYGLRR